MKLKLISLFLISFCMNQIMQGQNLVPNSSFDTSTLSPSYYGQICYPTGWSTPSGYCTVVVNHGSPDYYKTGGTGGAGVPTTFWATVSPHSGAGMAGFGTYLPSYTNFREYVRTTLTSPLIVGQSYEVSFWLTNGITWLNGHATNNIGVAFTTSPLTQPAAATILETPDVEYTSVLWDSLWHQLSFTYTATDASQYMTIGNFRTDASSIIVNVKTVCCPTSSAAYYYIDDVVVQPIPLLPIELLSFNAKKVNDMSALSWTTVNELNSDYFSVERSGNGYLFESIGTVQAKGFSDQPVNYKFNDDAPLPGLNYYRLKLTDANGDYKFSEVIQLNYEIEKQISISPNPATTEIIISTGTDLNGLINLYSQSGQKIKSINCSNQTLIIIPVADLPQGIYIVQYISGEGSIYSRFIKQ